MIKDRDIFSEQRSGNQIAECHADDDRAKNNQRHFIDAMLFGFDFRFLLHSGFRKRVAVQSGDFCVLRKAKRFSRKEKAKQ